MEYKHKLILSCRCMLLCISNIDIIYILIYKKTKSLKSLIILHKFCFDGYVTRGYRVKDTAKDITKSITMKNC